MALVLLPVLYLDFVIYQAGNTWIALAFLVVIAFGAYIYLRPEAYAFRYLFPGFLGFGLFVIFPLAYTVCIGFMKYSSQNLLPYDRALDLLQQETYLSGDVSYQYRLFAQDDGKYILVLQEAKNPSHRFAAEPIDLKAGQQPTGP